jgi:hypothetical protein
MVGAAGNRADLAELGAVLAPIKHAMRRLPPCMTATAHDACAISGRDEETARFNQTKKHRLHGTSRICTPGLSQPEKDIANPGAVHIGGRGGIDAARTPRSQRSHGRCAGQRHDSAPGADNGRDSEFDGGRLRGERVADCSLH